MSTTLILARHAGGEPARDALERDVAERAVAAGVTVWLTHDLYHLPEGCGLWADLASLPGRLACAGWLHPRPVTALLARHGVVMAEESVCDLGAAAEGAVAWARLSAVLGAQGAARGRLVGRPERPGQDRWYPVIDPARCVQCGHCRQFCLFGVYDVDARGRVRVTQPDRCKTGCPACSRICPQGAIMFPLYRDPAVAGAPGTAMHLDPAGRALFYNRTGQACPACGTAARTDPMRGGAPCPTCGRHTRDADTRPRDAIDRLLDDLDRLQDGRP